MDLKLNFLLLPFDGLVFFFFVDSANLGASLMDLGLVDLFEDFMVKARLLVCVTSAIDSTFHMEPCIFENQLRHMHQRFSL